MKRGEIWVGTETSDYARKPRPWIIIQGDRFRDTDSVLALPLTSVSVDLPLFRVAVGAGESTGLQTDSWVMLEKLNVMRRSRLHKRIGTIGDTALAELERKLMVVLGLAR